ncbi:MAG: zinc-dependent metalloprotease [Candidatus Palauibacterales bacterium]|nr:zinc-dependent metalloprotease [Candidatus Palauibacterales bacterium]
MKLFGSPRLTGTALAVLVAACVQVYPPSEQSSPSKQTASNGAKKDNGPFKPYAEVLKDTEELAGYFTFHEKRDNTLFLELKPDQLDMEFGLVMHYSRGVGDFNVQNGLRLSSTQLMVFERQGDQILLIERNTRFTADPGSPIAEGLKDNKGNSIIGAFPIKAEQEETKNLVADVTSFFVSDYADVGRRLKRWYGDHPVNFDKKRSYVSEVKAFPKNVEIDAMLTYKASDFPRFGGAGVSDYRSIPVGVRYSLFALPEDPMTPRLADDRVGHFIVAIEDFSRDQETSVFHRYVRRWRLEKQDPAAAVSEPVKPIVFYIDRSVPLEYRQYVKQGIEGWNKAYEAAGFKNAIVARQAPTVEEDPDWSPQDIRYSTIAWTPGYNMGYAIGPSQSDPRTGEQLNADILISWSFVRGWLGRWQRMGTPQAMIDSYMEAQEMLLNLPPEEAQYVCLAQMGKAHDLATQYAALIGLGVLDPGEPMPPEYIGPAIADLIMHEVGHTLALRHNFRASTGIPFDKLNDVTFTSEHGLMVSVMDYGTVNIAPDPKDQGDYYNTVVGDYDVWAIRYAYEDVLHGGVATNGMSVASGQYKPEDELPYLGKIAAEGSDPYLTYGSDEDNWIGPYAVDPLNSAWDMGSKPVDWARERAELVARVTPQLENRLIADGEGYQRLRFATQSMMFERFRSLMPVTRTVGGLYFVRDHRGSSRLPFTPVDPAMQRSAVKLLVDQAFAEDAFEFNPSTLNKLMPNRWSDWSTGRPFPVDFPVHQTVISIQSTLMAQLLEPVRIQRLIDNELRTPGEAYTAAELFSELTDASWSEISGSRARSVNSFRRNLQRAHADMLIDLALADDSGTPVPADARSLARLHMKRISVRIDGALEQGGLDDFTEAHLDETRARIERALKAQIMLPVEEN